MRPFLYLLGINCGDFVGVPRVSPALTCSQSNLCGFTNQPLLYNDHIGEITDIELISLKGYVRGKLYVSQTKRKQEL